MKLLSLLAVSTPTLVQAWSGAGHLLIARIAETILEKESPQTIKDVESILSILQKDFSNWTYKEKDHPFVECVTYADDIKYKGGSW